MKNSSQLKLTSIMVVPSHMAQLRAVAQSQGLNSSAVVRMLIARYVRRAAKQAGAAK
ncbi:MAG: hypothetical protein ABSE45_09800 [Candidatus Acidiferrales bacterium]|jgi:hypothetical protein